MKQTIVTLMTAILVFASSLQATHNYSIDSAAPAEDETLIQPATPLYREIQIEEFSKLVQLTNPTVKVVDARSEQNDNGKRIPGAKVIPVNATLKNISANLPDKDEMIIVYCSYINCPASGLLADRLAHMGYKNVWRYPGGIEEWEAHGQKIERGKPAAQAANEWGPKSA